MLTSQDLQFFCIVSAAPSLAAAARALDVTPSAVTQRLAQLEQRLGLRLVDRSGRRLQLTAEGALLAGRGTAVLAEIADIREALGERLQAVTGHLRVAAPFGFGRRHVAPVLAALRARHPGVRLTLDLFEDPVNLRPEGWDVLIHVGELADSSLTLRRLAPNRRLLCAAPAYLARHGCPRVPEDLQRHACAVIRENQSDVTLWRFRHADGRGSAQRIRPELSSNDGSVIRDWGLAGAAILLRSEWDVAEDLVAGRLVALLPDWHLPDADIVALFGPTGGRVARTAHFVELLQARLNPPPWRMAEAAPTPD